MTPVLQPYRVSDHGEVIYEALAAVDEAHARALVTYMHGGDVAATAKIETPTRENPQ